MMRIFAFFGLSAAAGLVAAAAASVPELSFTSTVNGILSSPNLGSIDHWLTVVCAVTFCSILIVVWTGQKGDFSDEGQAEYILNGNCKGNRSMHKLTWSTGKRKLKFSAKSFGAWSGAMAGVSLAERPDQSIHWSAAVKELEAQ
ncbi:hypothetical protein B0H10DRAFT_1961603 [Mycena sp. CBHHK59/15]|nr:hypothetical protein B0H10DRAFT_1961603 [Mycena sp. CBHHK59/15]